MSKGYKQIGQHDFDTIKALQEVGLSSYKAGRVTGRSQTTVNRIYEANSLAEYKEKIRSAASVWNEKARQRKQAAQTEDVPAETADPITEEPQRTHFSQDSVNLERIATALERLADAWEAQPTKRGLFSK